MPMPNLLETILTAQDGKTVDNLGARFGLDRNQTEAAMRELLPALSSGMKRQAATGDGLRALASAVDRDGHDRYLDRPELALADEARTEGDGILGHLLGSKDVSRAVAARASERTGISDTLLKQLLPVLASMAMGAIAKNIRGGAEGGGSGDGGLLGQILGGGASNSGDAGGGLLGGILGGMFGGGGGQGEAAPSLDGLGELGRMFDADGDGSSADDLLDSVFGKRR